MRPCTCGRTGSAVGGGRAPTGRAAAATTSGSALFWLRANVTGRPMAAARRRIQSISRSGAARSSPERAGRRQLEHAGAELAEHPADAEQLVLGGERAGHGLAVDGPVGEGAAGREAERAGLDALLHDGGHGLDVVGGGRLVARAALAHHVAAHRAVRHLRAEVHHVRRAGRARRGTRGSVSQPHWMPAVSAAPGMSSTPSISPMSHSWRSGGHRREADAAVAHHDGGDAVPARRRELLVPGGLAVVVGVDVDEAGRDERAVGVDLLAAAAVDRPDLGDDAVGDGDVGGAGRRAGAVDDGAPSDDEVVCGHGPPGRCDAVARSIADDLTPVRSRQAGGMAEAVYVDRDVAVERLELGDGAWVDVGRGWLRRRRRGLRAPARRGAVADEPAVPVRPRGRGAPARRRGGRAGNPLPHPALAEATRVAPAPLPGGVRRLRDAPVPRRHRRPGLPPRHRHAVPRRHDHRRPQPRRHPAVVPAARGRPATPLAPGKGATHDLAPGVGRPARDGRPLPGRLGALGAVPRRRGRPSARASRSSGGSPASRAARSRAPATARRSATAATADHRSARRDLDGSGPDASGQAGADAERRRARGRGLPGRSPSDRRRPRDRGRAQVVLAQPARRVRGASCSTAC